MLPGWHEDGAAVAVVARKGRRVFPKWKERRPQTNATAALRRLVPNRIATSHCPAGACLARDILTATLDVNHEHGTDLSNHASLVTA